MPVGTAWLVVAPYVGANFVGLVCTVGGFLALRHGKAAGQGVDAIVLGVVALVLRRLLASRPCAPVRPMYSRSTISICAFKILELVCFPLGGVGDPELFLGLVVPVAFFFCP